MDWKKVGKYASYGLYVIPFAGAIVEYCKPKEKKTKVGAVLSVLNIAVPLAKIAVIAVPYLVHKNYQDNKQIQEKSKNKLEQSVEIDTLNNKSGKKLFYYNELFY